MLALALVGAACSGSGGDDGDQEWTTPVSPSPTGEATAVAPRPTEVPPPTPTVTPVPPTPTPTAEPVGIDAAVEVWERFWVAVSVPDGADPGFAAALELGTQAAVDAVRLAPWGSRQREVHTFPKPTDNGDGTVSIEDCVLHFPDVVGAQWLRGTMTQKSAGAWQVASIERAGDVRECVPAEINDAAIAGYERYWDAQLDYWNPPDPNHPLIDATTVGTRRIATVARLEESSRNGWRLRGRSATRPEIVEITAGGSVVVSDCTQPPADLGVYDEDSGERLDDLVAPIEPGQRDLVSARLDREDGVWKVGELRLNERAECEFAPTAAGLPIV